MTIPLNFKIYGSGDPIIILHGFMGSLDNWQTFAKKLAEDYMVITVDQRNHGRSGHDDRFTYELMVEDLKALMESEWVHTATIIGHSMGGKTAMKFAMLYPDMVEKLIIVDISPKSYPPGHNDVLKAMNAVPIDRLTDRKEAEDVLRETIADKGVRLFLMKNLMRISRSLNGVEGSGYRWKVNLPILTKQYGSILEKITGEPFDEPVLFIRGGNSKYILDDDLDYIREIFPEGELVTIPEAGHWVHAEKPMALLETVHSFLQ